MDEMIWETFLPFLFLGKYKNISPIVVTLITMTVKKSGLGLLNPVISANKKYTSFQCAIKKLIQAVMEEGVFSNANHLLDLR